MSFAPIFVAGHSGMVGSAILRRLLLEETDVVLTRSSQELDLRCQEAVESFFDAKKPKIVIVAAARVGGILANETYPAEFAYDNLMIAANVVHAAHRFGVERLLFLGSTCIYPREAAQPIREEALLSGPLEQTNEAYAVAKIAGVKLCQFYRRQFGVLFHSVMPTNLYGPGDNYRLEYAHVLPALIRRFYEAKVSQTDEVVIWGSGKPTREFLHVDDLADAVVHLLGIHDPPDWVNVGTGRHISVQEAAELVADIVGFYGRITNDLSRPDGTMYKRTDGTLLAKLGWRARIGLREGISKTYTSFLRELESGTIRLK